MARALKSAVVLDCERDDAEKRSPLRPLRIQFSSKQVEISMLGNGAGAAVDEEATMRDERRSHRVCATD